MAMTHPLPVPAGGLHANLFPPAAVVYSLGDDVRGGSSMAEY